MTSFAVLIFALVFLGGGARVIYSFRGDYDQRKFLTGFVAALTSAIGLVFLWMRVASAADILIGVLLVSLLMEVAAANVRLEHKC